MKKLLIILLLSSCSIQKRADKALKRIGADPLLTSIKNKHPEKFYTDTTPRFVTITKVDTFEIVTNQVLVDTFITQIKDTCDLSYEDSNIFISINGSSIKYKIKSKVKKIVSPPKVHTIKCPDCPPVPKPPKEPVTKNNSLLWIIGIILSFSVGLLLGVKYAKK